MNLRSLNDSIEQLHRARQDLQRHEFAVQALFERLNTPLLLLDAAGLIRRCNAGFDTRFGYPDGELIDQPFFSLCTPKQAEISRERLTEALHDPAAVPSWTLRLRHHDGERRAYTVSARAVELDAQAPGLLLHCLARDDPSLLGETLAGVEGRPSPAKSMTLGRPTLPSDRPVLGRDLAALPQRLGCTTTRCCSLLGVATMAYYDWRSRPEAPVPNHPVALHVRLLDAFPQLAAVSYTPEDLQGGLQQAFGRPVTLIELSLLVGMERTSGYRWRRGIPPSEMASALIHDLGRLLACEPPGAVAAYRALVEAEARALGIDDLWRQGNWKPLAGKKKPKKKKKKK